MRNHIVSILVVLGTFASTSAFADQTERTGQACKQHLRQASLTPAIASALQNFDSKTYQTPGEVKLKHIQYRSEMPNIAQNYVKRVGQVLGNCETHCQGLQMNTMDRETNQPKTFLCKQLGDATANIIHLLIRDNALLSDSTNLQLEPAFTQTEVDEAANNPEPTVAQPAQTIDRSNYFINRADAPRDELIEL